MSPYKKARPFRHSKRKNADALGMNDISAIGLQGMIKGQENASRDASRVVNSFSGSSTEDVAAPLVDLQRDSLQVEASAKVVKLGNDMVGSILDLLG